jgi:hypothetical protein
VRGDALREAGAGVDAAAGVAGARQDGAAGVVQVVKERSSTRGLVTLRARPSQFHPDGIEHARTERTDGPEGLPMARTLRGLTGHRVALWIEEQTTGNGARKVRVIQHVKDLGWADDDRDSSTGTVAVGAA